MNQITIIEHERANYDCPQVFSATHGETKYEIHAESMAQALYKLSVEVAREEIRAAAIAHLQTEHMF